MSEEINAQSLADMTLSRLYELARERKVANPRKYKKQELIDMILGAVPVPEEPASSSNGSGPAASAEPAATGDPRDRRPQRPGPREPQARPGPRESAPPAPAAGPAYGPDFTPPSQQAEESDYIEDEPAREPAFAPRPLNRGDYPSSQLGGGVQPQQQQQQRPGQRQGRYDDRRGGGRDGRHDQRQDLRGGLREPRPGGMDRGLERGADRGMARDMESAIPAKGVLEIIEDANYGFIRQRAFHLGEDDIYVSMSQIKKFGLRTGDVVEGFVRPAREQERYQSLVKVDKVNSEPFTEEMRRISFDKLTPIYPNQRILLETDAKEISTRLIDLFSPIGRGTRGIIVAKPKAGKTVMLKKIAHAVATNHPDIELIALLIDERPEEVTDFERNIQGLVVSSTFDEKPENHIQVAELVIEYAKRRDELGQDVFLLLDSLTRLARAYNLTCAPSGKTLSGGLDPNSLYKPKRFLGAARKIENGGSLTILCSALVETGSRLDDIIFEEFKGTANMELHLSRELADKRIFPSVDIIKSGTRHEELLYNAEEMDVVWRLRKMVADMDEAERMNRLITRMVQTKSNIELLVLIQKATE